MLIKKKKKKQTKAEMKRKILLVMKLLGVFKNKYPISHAAVLTLVIAFMLYSSVQFSRSVVSDSL